MKIKIRKVVRQLHLRDFAEEYEDDSISVWVNPPRSKLAEYEEIRAETSSVIEEMKKLADNPETVSDEQRETLAEKMFSSNGKIYGWYADIWGQPCDEVKEFASQCEKEDPALWVFLMQKTWELINQHRNQSGKG